MSGRMLTFACTRDEFRPFPLPGCRWWRVEDWEEARGAQHGMWATSSFWSEEEWQNLYGDGYRYCVLLKAGRAVATAGLCPRLAD